MDMEALDIEYITLKLLDFAESEWGWESFSEYMNSFDDRRGKCYDVPGLGNVEIVDYHDYDVDKNYDSWAEDIWIVFRIKGGLYRAKGKHSSYESSVWEDEVTRVVPKIKHVVEYEDA